MEPAMKNEMNCKTAAEVIPDLLFDPTAASAKARAHLASCQACQGELQALQGTMSLLDTWEAPEPTPFWTVRMGAMLREEQARPASGWVGFKDRLRTRFWLSDHSIKPAFGVAALSLVLTVGGGAWLDVSHQPAAPLTQASNTVRDLQSLNENAQVFQQLSVLDSTDAGAQTSN